MTYEHHSLLYFQAHDLIYACLSNNLSKNLNTCSLENPLANENYVPVGFSSNFSQTHNVYHFTFVQNGWTTSLLRTTNWKPKKEPSFLCPKCFHRVYWLVHLVLLYRSTSWENRVPSRRFDTELLSCSIFSSVRKL